LTEGYRALATYIQKVDGMVLSLPGDQLSSGTEPRLLWSLYNQQEATWLYAQISFSLDTPCRITFVGVRANDVLGIIAIDDVTLFTGGCSLQPKEVRGMNTLSCDR